MSDGAFTDDITEFYRLLTPEQVMGGIAKALKAHDFEAVITLLRVLAVKDPHQAGIVYEAMAAVLAGGEDGDDDGSRG